VCFFALKNKKTSKGFSLTELLIALAIMGILAVFTIPPLLQAPNGSIQGIAHLI
jgi:prepilin-type N-terminal cleavage/methylation domain-containing protein